MDKQNIKSITPDPLFMKDVFDDWDSKNLKRHCIIIEMTFDSFGIQVNIVEVKIFPESFCFVAKLLDTVDIKEVIKHDKDLAIALAWPGGKVAITEPLQGKNVIAVFVPRVNTIGQQVVETRKSLLCKPVGNIRWKLSKWLLGVSENFFRRSEKIYGPISVRYPKIN